MRASRVIRSRQQTRHGWSSSSWGTQRSKFQIPNPKPQKNPKQKNPKDLLSNSRKTKSVEITGKDQ